MVVLEVKELNKRFGGLRALSDVNLQVEEGTIHAVIGPNGAGKSTLLNCFIGKLVPDEGEVNFDGQTLLGRKPFEINQMGVSRVFQTPEVFADLTVLENVMIACFAKRDGQFKLNMFGSYLKQHDILEQAEHLLQDVSMLDKRYTTAASLSRGDKRRLELAMCLSQQPRLLLLDEPTAGMARADTNNTIDLLQEIHATKKLTKVIIEHDMHVVFSLAQKVTVMAQGTPIVEGTPQEIKGNPKVQEAYLGNAHS